MAFQPLIWGVLPEFRLSLGYLQRPVSVAEDAVEISGQNWDPAESAEVRDTLVSVVLDTVRGAELCSPELVIGSAAALMHGGGGAGIPSKW